MMYEWRYYYYGISVDQSEKSNINFYIIALSLFFFFLVFAIWFKVVGYSPLTHARTDTHPPCSTIRFPTFLVQCLYHIRSHLTNQLHHYTVLCPPNPEVSTFYIPIHLSVKNLSIIYIYFFYPKKKLY